MKTKCSIILKSPIWLLATLGLFATCSDPETPEPNKPVTNDPVEVYDPPTIQISKLDMGELISQTDNEAFVTVLRRKIQFEGYSYSLPLGITYAIDIPNGIKSTETSENTPSYEPILDFTPGEKEVLLTWYPGRIRTGLPVTLTVTDRASKKASFTIYPSYEVNLNPTDVVNGSWEKTTFEESFDDYRPDLIATADKSLIVITEGHLQKSSDKGVTWKKITVSGIASVGTITLHPSGTLYAGSGISSKISQSKDNGNTWALLTTNLPASGWTVGIESMCITEAGTLQLALIPNVWRSQDGEVWYKSNSDNLAGYHYSVPLMVTLNDSTTLAIGREGGWYWPCLIRSSDFGKTWKCLDVSEGAWFTNILYASDGNVYASADQGIYKSEDLGATWTKLVSGIPDGFQNIVNTIIEGSDGKIYAAPLDYGVFRLEGDSWKSVGTDLAAFNVTNMVAIEGDIYAAVEASSLFRLK